MPAHQVDARDQKISILTAQLTEFQERHTVLLALLQRLTPVLVSLQEAGIDLKVKRPEPLTAPEQRLLANYRVCSQGNRAALSRIAAELAPKRRQKGGA